MSEALRKAAEQAEELLTRQVLGTSVWCLTEANEIVRALRAALAEPEQSEPVAYELYAAKFAKGKQLVYKVPEFLASYVNVRPLYAAPPRREPLTPEQINLCWHTARNKADQVNELMLFARAIEAAHGIGVKP